MQRFEPVDQKIGFPELERPILEFWREADVFARSIELRKDDPLWVFYEGPPTANGTPGIHHVEARVFKDVYPRYKTMTGHFVPGKAAGTATDSRWSSRWRRRSAPPGSATSRRSGSPSSTACAGIGDPLRR